MRQFDRVQFASRLSVGRGAKAGSALLAILLLAGEARAQPGEGGGCHGPRIVETAPLNESWSRALQDARYALRAVTNLDRCAVILLLPRRHGLRVQIALEDGRGTSRDIAESTELLLTLEALLILPQAEQNPIRREPPLSTSEASHEAPPVAERASFSSAPHFEAGLGASVRIAGSPLYLGAGAAAFAQASLGSWLFGVMARWDAADWLVSEAVPSGFNMQTLEMGVVAGHRTTLRVATLDLLIGPQLRVENQEAFGGQGAADGIGGGTSDIRLDAALRISAASNSAVRFFGEVDLDASPRRLSQTHRLDPQLPSLPSWSTGLTFGAVARLP